jgi:hypothetical protein
MAFTSTPTPRVKNSAHALSCQLSFAKVHGNNSRLNLRRLKLLGLRLRRRCLDSRPPVQYRRDGFVQTLHLFAIIRVTRLGKILPFGLLSKGPGNFLGTNMVCFKYFKSLERFDVDIYFQI